jgi:hypothetical protein
MAFLLFFLFGVVFAGEPVIKGGKLVDDSGPALVVKAKSMPGGSSVLMIETLSGTPVSNLMVLPFTPGQVQVTGDFLQVHLSVAGQVQTVETSAVVLELWKAGALTREGTDPAALQAWASGRGLKVTDNEETARQLAAYGASHPAPSFAPAAPAAARPAPTAGTTAASGPATVSVSLHISCAQKVRLFFGSAPNSGGTYGWEETNTTRSSSVKPGSVICITDSHDKVQTCWTAGTTRADLDVSCGGFRQR